MDSNLKQLCEDVVGAVFELNNHLDDEGFHGGSAKANETLRRKIQKVMSASPPSQTKLVIDCLTACREMDTAEEAKSYLNGSDD
jgi:hypothetical protein